MTGTDIHIRYPQNTNFYIQCIRGVFYDVGTDVRAELQDSKVC